MDSQRLFTAGNCPVCADSGTLLCVWSIVTTRVILFCPLCEVAWQDVPKDGRIDTVHALDDLAPGGIRLATETEVRSFGLDRVLEVGEKPWLTLLGDHLLQA